MYQQCQTRSRWAPIGGARGCFGNHQAAIEANRKRIAADARNGGALPPMHIEPGQLTSRDLLGEVEIAVEGRAPRARRSGLGHDGGKRERGDGRGA